jgi:phosphoadenosine phosphosulfate reductase
MTQQSIEADESPYLQSTQEIVDRFDEQTDPDYVYALVSGGGDSDTACEVAQEFGIELSGVVHVNTGIGIEDTRRYVLDRCREWDIAFHELTSMNDADNKRSDDGVSMQERQQEIEDSVGLELAPHPYEDVDTNYYGVRRDNDDYEKLVRKMGFPGPSMHWIMYLALKHKPIKNFVEYFHDEDDEVAFVSGVRQKESDRRAENMSDDGLSENWGECTVVSPIAEWSESDVTTYRQDRNLPSNPVSDILGMSGECLCGAFGSRDEFEELKKWGFSDTAKQIEQLEMELFNGQVSKGYVAEEYALWGHGNTQQINEYRGEETPQMLLCADCDDKCDPAVMSEEEKVSKAEVALDKNAHCEVWDRWFYCPDCQTVFDDPIEHRQTVHAVTSGAPYLDHVPWDIREINTNASGAELTEPVTTDPEMTRERRIRDYVGQTLTSPTHTCEFTPTNQPGVEHCNDCGTYKLQPGESFTDMIADASDGASIEELMKIEPGVLSTVIPNDKIIETNVITSADELETVTTTDEIATLLIERVNSLTKYLDTEPSFDRLVRESGLDVFLDEFDLDASDVLDPDACSSILSELNDAAADEEDETGPLQPAFDPGQKNMAAFTTQSP